MPFIDTQFAINIILFLMGLLVVVAVLFVVVSSVDTQSIVALGSGLLVGACASFIFSLALSFIVSFSTLLVGLAIMVAITSITMIASFQKRKELFPQFSKQEEKVEQFINENKNNLILDDKVLYDARILNFLKTGFFDKKLELTTPVIKEVYAMFNHPTDQELQRKGKRMLETINKLKENFSSLLVVTDERGTDETLPLREQLFDIARRRGNTLLTADFGIIIAAQKEGVAVLNILSIVNAMQSVIFVGEQLHVKLIQEGASPHEVVGFLPDGSRVVVDDAQHLLGKEADVIVVKILETIAGRVIYATPV